MEPNVEWPPVSTGEVSLAPAEDWNTTPTRPIRVPLDLWARFGEAATRAGTDRSAVLRDFMRWYAREPGAKLPKRPAVPDDEQVSGD